MERMPTFVLGALKERLQQAIGFRKNINVELADMLNLSVESVYRRFRGEASFTLDELWIITNQLQIDLSSVLSSGNTIPVSYTPFYADSFKVERHIASFESTLKMLAENGCTLHSLSCDVPLFRIFGYKSLAAFKLFYWENLIEPDSNDDNHTFHRYGDKSGLFMRLHEWYNKTHVQEVWTKNTLNGTLDQIEYFCDCGQIPDAQDVFDIYNDLIQLVDDLFNQSDRKGWKTELFIYELSLNNNSFFVQHEHNCMQLNIAINGFNALNCQDERLLKEYRRWLDVVYSRSYKISGQSRRLRYDLLTKFKQQIKQSASTRLPQSLSDKLL